MRSALAGLVVVLAAAAGPAMADDSGNAAVKALIEGCAAHLGYPAKIVDALRGQGFTPLAPEQAARVSNGQTEERVRMSLTAAGLTTAAPADGQTCSVTLAKSDPPSLRAAFLAAVAVAAKAGVASTTLADSPDRVAFRMTPIEPRPAAMQTVYEMTIAGETAKLTVSQALLAPAAAKEISAQPLGSSPR